MSNDSTKISFIPKNSLIGQDPFLARRRPRSVLGILAIVLFFTSIVAYIGIYAYKITLDNKIKAKTSEILSTTKKLKESEEIILRAKAFQARTQIGKEVLHNHTAISPLFKFLQENTLQVIQFESFHFKFRSEGSKLVLKGEVPGYASLAFQSDVLKKQNQELLGFVITDVKLTSLGNITFSLEETISPSFISYIRKSEDAVALPNSSDSSLPFTVPAAVDSKEAVVPTESSTVLSTTTPNVVAPVEKSSGLSKKFFDLFK